MTSSPESKNTPKAEDGDHHSHRQQHDNEKDAAAKRLQRAQWLRAAILGANDGLLSTTSLMLGVGAVKEDDGWPMVLSGVAGALAGACSMAVGEFVSVSTQRDIEKAATYSSQSRKRRRRGTSNGAGLEEEKEAPDRNEIRLDVFDRQPTNTATCKEEDRKLGEGEGESKLLPWRTPTSTEYDYRVPVQYRSPRMRSPSSATTETMNMAPSSEVPKLPPPSPCLSGYGERSPPTIKLIIKEEEEEEAADGKIRTDASRRRRKSIILFQEKDKDEDEGEVGVTKANPYKAAAASAMAFLCGSCVPLLCAILIAENEARIVVIAVVTSLVLAFFGGLGAHLGGSPIWISALRVLVGGWIAMAITYGLLKPFDNGKQKDD